MDWITSQLPEQSPEQSKKLSCRTAWTCHAKELDPGMTHGRQVLNQIRKLLFTKTWTCHTRRYYHGMNHGLDYLTPP